jgi:hypothetical protein
MARTVTATRPPVRGGDCQRAGTTDTHGNARRRIVPHQQPDRASAGSGDPRDGSRTAAHQHEERGSPASVWSDSVWDVPQPVPPPSSAAEQLPRADRHPPPTRDGEQGERRGLTRRRRNEPTLCSR